MTELYKYRLTALILISRSIFGNSRNNIAHNINNANDTEMVKLGAIGPK